MIGVTVLMTIGRQLLLTRSIVLPLAQSLKVAEGVAGGDLTGDIRISGKDEPARLLQALKSMQQSLRDTLFGASPTRPANWLRLRKNSVVSPKPRPVACISKAWKSIRRRRRSTK